MNYEITEEQIKQLYKSAKNETNQLVEADLKKWFPEVFEIKLEVGKWFYIEEYKKVAFLEKECNGNFKGYGFNYKNDFYNNVNENGIIFRNHLNRLATDSEVEEALINEAKKRGFKEGVCFNIVNGEREPILIGNKERFCFDEYGNKLLMNNWCIFENGKWAEIIKTYTKEEAEKMLNAKII